MKLVGICRVFKLEEVSEKCAKGQVYFSTKRGEDEKGNAQFETSFINARIVGKAKKQLDELATVMDVEKLKIENPILIGHSNGGRIIINAVGRTQAHAAARTCHMNGGYPRVLLISCRRHSDSSRFLA